MKRISALALLLALTATASAQQKQTPVLDKEKAERQRAEHFKKFTAPMMAEAEQRKVIIRDLLDTCAKCSAADDAYFNAPEGSEQARLSSISSSNCHEILDAKLSRTSLDTLAPYLDIIKGADLQMVKRIAIWNLYAAYEYGSEHPKLADSKRP